MSASKELFQPTQAMLDHGVDFIFAHPDDPEGLMRGAVDVLTRAGVPTSFIALSMGELGIPQDWPNMTPLDMKDKRLAEFERSCTALGVNPIPLDFPDIYMSLGRVEPVVEKVTDILRKEKFATIFTFHPNIMSEEVEHPDHNFAGLVGRYSSMLNVTHFFPEYRAPARRPGLFYLTDDTMRSTHVIELLYPDLKKKYDHLEEYFPSQFRKADRREWSQKLDRVTFNPDTGKHEEHYFKVRD